MKRIKEQYLIPNIEGKICTEEPHKHSYNCSNTTDLVFRSSQECMVKSLSNVYLYSAHRDGLNQ